MIGPSIRDHNKPVTVLGYDPTLGAKQFKIVSAVLGYQDELTGLRYHLVVHQAIHIPHLDHHLLCPMQCRVNGVEVDECPKHLSKAPTVKTHAIVAPVDDGNGELILPLKLKHVTSYLSVYKPTEDEWESHSHPRIELTSEHLTWDPATTHYEEEEERMADCHGDLVRVDSGTTLVVNSLTSLTPMADFTHDYNFGSVLQSKVRVSSVGTGPGRVESKQMKAVDAPTLSRRWMIPHERAKNTIKLTTQRGIRHVTRGNITRRFPTNDRMLRYPRLPHTMFTDTLLAGQKSSHGI